MIKFPHACRSLPVLTLLLLPLAAMAEPLTAEFQQNDFYQGTVMMSLGVQSTIVASETTAALSVDGGDKLINDPLYSLIFLKFDEIFGDLPGQVPYGSTIVRADLELTTNVSSNAQSTNIFTIAPLINPLLLPDTGSILAAYSDQAGTRGPDFEDGHTGRPGNPFRSVNAPILTQDQGERTFNDLTEIVRQWAQGTVEAPLNNGLIISDTNGTDGWAIASIGNNTPTNRPKLHIEYYPPAVAVERNAGTLVFVQGAEVIANSGVSYEGGVSAFLPDTVTAVNHANFATLANRVPEEGSAIVGVRYLDGANPPTFNSTDDQMIIQFNEIFGDQPGQIKILPNLKIERASLRMTTGSATDNKSPGPVDVHRMLTPWFTTDELLNRTYKRYTEFTAPGAPAGTIGLGPTEASGDVAPLDFSYLGMQNNQVLDADVTASVKAWAAGQPNYGWSVQQSTSDGWGIYFPGAGSLALRPQLVVSYSYDPDTDSDGLPDAWELANGTQVAVADAGGDADGDTLTNLQEYQMGTRGNLADTDGDGYSDKVETKTGTWAGASDTGTNPLVADTDGDGLADGLENPALPYTGATQPGTNPNLMDSDGDGFPDSTELAFEKDPSSSTIVPAPDYQNVLADNFDGVNLNSNPNYLTTLGTFYAGIYDSTVAGFANVVQLTDGSPNSNSSVAWDFVPAKGKAVRLTFDYRMSADIGAAENADGFGLGLFRVAAYDEAGAANPGVSPKAWEDPRAGGGLAEALHFGFDIYNGTAEGNNLRITGPGAPGAALVNVSVPFPLNNGTFNRVVITATTLGTATALSLDIIADVAGSAPVTHPLVKNLVVPGFNVNTEEFRIIAGGRTGTSVVKTELDNVSLAVAGAAITQPALPSFDISSIVKNDNTLTISWSSVSGGIYTLEKSGSMTGIWSTVGQPLTASGLLSSLTDTLPATPPNALFYRVRRTQ